MNEQVKKVRERIIEHSSHNSSLFSMHPTVSRLLSVMYYYENKPMTLDDMTKELEMSKGSMSNAVRELLEIGLVEKVWEKGERRDLYVVEQDNYECFIKFFTHQWRKPIIQNVLFMNKCRNDLKELLDKNELDDETTTLIQKDLDKLEAGLEYFHWLSRLVDFFESKEVFDHVPKERHAILTGQKE